MELRKLLTTNFQDYLQPRPLLLLLCGEQCAEGNASQYSINIIIIIGMNPWVRVTQRMQVQ